MEINELLDTVVQRNASDLHLTVGRPPTVRLHGELVHLTPQPLSSEDTERYAKAVTSDKR